GGAYIPAFCDIVIMVDKNASMYLGSPRMAEKVIGEKVTLEEMGGARMHCSTSGCGDVLADNEEHAIELGRSYLSYFPGNFHKQPPHLEGKLPSLEKSISEIVPENQNAPFN
ncbi:carboxyl transferase domain-containing protein, partial [Staphylococcus sp. SIMBA_130]